MLLRKTYREFQKGKINKQQYIDKMHTIHQVLFAYADFLKSTDIESIKISDGQVIMTARKSGIKLVCNPKDKRLIPFEIINFGKYEEKDFRMALKLISENDTVFDIGANIGWYSLNLASTSQNLNLLAFEPLRPTFEYLKQNLELNQQKIRIFNFGFSEAEKEVDFYYYPEGSGNASLANLSDNAEVQSIPCLVRTLDGFMREYGGHLNFVKCDVEGAELFVFQGGLETLRHHKPIVFTEMLRKWAAKFNYHPNQIIELFRALGYRCFTSDGSSLLEFKEMNDRTTETNFFFLHAKEHGEKIKALSGQVV